MVDQEGGSFKSKGRTWEKTVGVFETVFSRISVREVHPRCVSPPLPPLSDRGR